MARFTNRLLKSVGALMLALAATVAARQFAAPGQLAVRLGLVAFALALCVYVVYLCVPLMARWGVWQRIPPLSFRLTREGLVFLLAVIAVAGIALVSGNNLVYLVLSCLLGLMVLSGFVSRLGLAGLQLDISFPQHIFARQRALARVSVRNLKRWMPSFSIWIGAAPGVRPDPGVTMEDFYCPMISGGSRAVASLPITFARRGRFRQETFWLRSRFPLSLVERRTRLEMAQEVLVYPAVEAAAEVEEALWRFGHFLPAPARGDSHDLYRIRPAVADDGARFVDWKASARSRTLMVREFTRQDQREAAILLDRVAPQDARGEARFEKLVEACAAVAWRLHLLHTEVQFSCEETSIRAASNSSAIYEILRYLALVAPAAPDAPHPVLDLSSPDWIGGQRYKLIFSLRPKGNLPRLQSSEGHYFVLGS